MPECGDAKLFEVLGGEAREHPLVDLVVAECRLVQRCHRHTDQRLGDRQRTAERAPVCKKHPAINMPVTSAFALEMRRADALD